MILVEVLSGSKAGWSRPFSSSRISIGRAAGNEVVLSDPGVWESHLVIRVNEAAGFLEAEAVGDATAWIGHEPVRNVRLRGATIVSLGEASVRVGLAPVRQKPLIWRERLTWAGLAGVVAFELALIYLLVG